MKTRELLNLTGRPLNVRPYGAATYVTIEPHGHLRQRELTPERGEYSLETTAGTFKVRQVTGYSQLEGDVARVPKDYDGVLLVNNIGTLQRIAHTLWPRATVLAMGVLRDGALDHLVDLHSQAPQGAVWEDGHPYK